MSLASDYFLLYHGLSLSKYVPVVIDEGLEDECFFEISALLLSLNRKSLEKAAGLNSFAVLCSRLTKSIIDHPQELYHLQQTLVKHILLRKSEKNLAHLHKSFNYLSHEAIISKAACEKLVSLFDPSMFKSEEDNITVMQKQRNDGFKVQKQEILLALNELSPLFYMTEELDEIAEYLNSQKFSIGITGVMNAGKSTMLNALLGKEVLGTSVVPETANLSIISYSSKPEAKVVYWNRSQWKRIEQSAKEIKSMASFIQDTYAHFKQDINEYILEESRVDNIDINELGSYTSAGDESKRCNLVKQVELGCELHFLHEGIEIVDTPGLDDIVIQREEITKQYIAQCDLMIHLMNVSQSATSKDIEFIVDALVYQNVTKVLVVITRIDTVSEADVQEVIDYTKASLIKRLHAINEDTKLDLVLKGLDFIALSGKMALLHKTGRSQEAIEAGYSLEKSGITRVEAFLEQTLFSKDNERSMLVIRSAKKRLNKAVESELERMHRELASLSKSETELDVELEELRQKKSRESKRLEDLKEQIIAYEDELNVYLKTQESLMGQELIKLQSIIRQRLLDDVRYCLEKEKRTPSPVRIKDIIEKSLRHGLIDVVRDYRHRLSVKTEKVEEVLFGQYPELFDASARETNSFENGFDRGFLVSNNEVLVSRLTKLITKSSLKSLLQDDKQMVEVIKEEFSHLEALVKSRALEVSQHLLDGFFTRIDHSADKLLKRLERDEQSLQACLLSINEDETSRTQRSLELHKKTKMIEFIARRCQG
jgi:GTP-binding protein EngB required for normal cell division